MIIVVISLNPTALNRHKRLNLAVKSHLEFHQHLASNNWFEPKPVAFLDSDFAKYAKVHVDTMHDHNAYRGWSDHSHS